MKIIRERNSTVANWISLSRLVLLIPLRIWVLEGRFILVGWGLVYTGISDILDGLAARERGRLQRRTSSVAGLTGVKAPDLVVQFVYLSSEPQYG